VRAILFDGLQVEVDARTAGLGGSFYNEPLQSYGPLPLRWAYEQLQLQTDPVLLDVGASTGCYTLLAAHIPTLRVHAFEPVWAVREVLEANIDLNNVRDRVVVSPYAISDYCVFGDLHTTKELGGSGCSMFNGKPYRGKEVDTERCGCTTIDYYCQQNEVVPTMIKLDIEGGERAALKGATETIEAHHPVLIVEYEPLNTAQYGYGPWKLARMLEEYGYKYINPEGLDLLALYQGRQK
jgi:FkbM family methyltransferase